MLDVIENAFNKALERKPENRLDTVYVTELSGCIRRSWYRRKYGYRMNKEMIAGSAVHTELLDRVADVLAGSPGAGFDYVVAEKGVEKLFDVNGSGVWLAGRLDLFIAGIQNSVRTFIEFKTSEWIFEEHIEQGNIYAVMLDVDRFYICYMPKSDQVKCKEFERTWTEKEVVERIQQLLSGSEPPKREGTWCSYCEFRNMCRKTKTLI